MPSLQSDADSMLFKLEQPDSQGDFVLYLWTDSLLSHLLKYSICFSVVVASPHCLTKNIWFVLLPFPSRAGTYTPYKGKKSHSNKLHVWQKHTLHVKHEVHQHSNFSITNIYTNAISATGESYHTVLTLLLWVLLTVLIHSFISIAHFAPTKTAYLCIFQVKSSGNAIWADIHVSKKATENSISVSSRIVSMMRLTVGIGVNLHLTEFIGGTLTIKTGKLKCMVCF